MLAFVLYVKENILFVKRQNFILLLQFCEKGEKLINERELHMKLESKRQFANWIKQRIEQHDFIENIEFICFNKFVKVNKYGNKNLKE